VAHSAPLARNTFLNILGLGIPLLVGLVSIPVLASQLGDTRFGILGLVWGVIGYFSVFDLGLSRANPSSVVSEMSSSSWRVSRRSFKQAWAS
jgi:hypothetical protein